MSITEITDSLQPLLEQPATLYIVGGVLLLVAFTILMLRRQPSKVVAYVTENGRVMVSRSAIVELVQTSCEQLNDVSKPRVRIKLKGRVTHLEVFIKLLSGGRLRTVEETLQAHLRHALSENLGIEELGQINIVADGFKSGRIQASSKVQPLPDPTVDTLDEEPVDLADEEKSR